MDAIPALSVEGFITNKPLMVVKLYEHFLASDFSQSNIFYGEIASMKYIISEATTADDLKTMATEALEKMYLRYFPSVVVGTIIDETDSNISLTINIVVTDTDGKIYKLNRIMSSTDNHISNFDLKQELNHA